MGSKGFHKYEVHVYGKHQSFNHGVLKFSGGLRLHPYSCFSKGLSCHFIAYGLSLKTLHYYCVKNACAYILFYLFFFPKSLGKYAAAAISIGLIINRIFKKCPDEPAAVNTSKIETPGFKTRAEPGGWTIQTENRPSFLFGHPINCFGQ